MDVAYIMAGISVLIIFSYLFDAFARRTQFPSVILLIATGIGLRWLADATNYHIPYLDRIIPTFGTIGLILIVLEGALELEINKKKRGIIIQGFLSALITLLLTAFGLAFMFHEWMGIPFLESLLDATPLAIISSAVAIPSAAGLLNKDKEFVVYESTFSDILGIVLFYFLKSHLVNDSTGLALEVPKLVTAGSFMSLIFEIILVVIISLVVTYILIELIAKISHKVKFFLILSLLILAYVIAKKFHLSALIIVFFFGLFMSNSRNLLPIRWRKYINTTKAEEGLHEFHILTAESTFLIRTGFFLFFGFNITVDMFLSGETYIYGLAILGVILAVRFLYLGVTQPKKLVPTGFIAPRGLITILLFLDLPIEFSNKIINEKVLLIVILGSMIIMLTGLLITGKKKGKNDGEGGEKVNVDFNTVGDV
ncbi:cation:proton antiporter [Weeksellaceae bacterium KMM 9713]|uniref:Cation:proton antiporter n=1 Tax=Profundicola chukchiensis TaxID=2961959 RepID=A0A9X4MZK4_9FLAO|nr:cation:proton antiporter [Profundicola chukchiensis]MDG4946552.1 cation:proton antiporter [Profundicola chukchiensis]